MRTLDRTELLDGRALELARQMEQGRRGAHEAMMELQQKFQAQAELIQRRASTAHQALMRELFEELGLSEDAPVTIDLDYVREHSIAFALYYEDTPEPNAPSSAMEQ